VAKTHDTGGTSGVTISRSTIVTGGGDIVGRDKVGHGSPEQLEHILQPLVEAINAVDPVQRARATEKLQALKSEMSKGKNANDSTMAKLIDGIVALIPTAVGAFVSIFATPFLAGLAGPATRYVLDKIQGK
jgi:hypothetical protein